jgi:type IV pilus assembly protein PilW
VERIGSQAIRIVLPAFLDEFFAMNTRGPMPIVAESPSSRRPAGFSLVEVLVALVAGIVLSATVLQVFLSSKQTYQVGDQMSRVQENSRYAMDVLSREVRMAGSLGCTSQVRTKILNTLNQRDTLYFNFAVPVEGFEAGGTGPGSTFEIKSEYPAPATSGGKWSPNLPSGLDPELSGQVIEGSDVLVVRGRIGGTGYLTGLTNDNASVTGLSADEMKAGRIAMVADCGITRVFQVTGASAGQTGTVLSHEASQSGSPGNSCGPWNAKVGPGPCRAHVFPVLDPGAAGAPAEVSRVATTIFFVGRREKTGDSNPGPSLYQRVGNGNKEELVEGVDNMQILYGIADDAGNVQFVPAGPGIDWAAARVVSIRIGLLMRTVDNAAPLADTAKYLVNGTTINPYDDRRLRKVITTTIGIRTQLN